MRGSGRFLRDTTRDSCKSDMKAIIQDKFTLIMLFMDSFRIKDSCV